MWIEGVCGHLISSGNGYFKSVKLEITYKCPTCELTRDEYRADKVRKQWLKLETTKRGPE